ncbi:hypothetical protein C2G38_2166534 [Gigaspora rosea]|uniref:Uncharacterized protein n=1 Tax=Gigaspora rosea TaxID=44941 RepID=A0A397VTV5_9GLOM|nr:hypothetical protein C2G38_2166534 [Gigaspora rosea]
MLFTDAFYTENVSTASTEYYNNNINKAKFIENTDYLDARYFEYAENNTSYFDDENFKNIENRTTTSQVALFISSAKSNISVLFSRKVLLN